MAWIELATIVVLFGGMALVFGWLEIREKRRIHTLVETLVVLVEPDDAEAERQPARALEAPVQH